MCGIVGLHLKNPGLQSRLGELLTQMLEAMTTRGPDSAGIAGYADRDPAPAAPGPEQGPEPRHSPRPNETLDWGPLAQPIRPAAGRGIRCDTDNDSEVAARLVAARMAEGADLEEGLRTVLKEMDGFFTLLVTTRTQFAVVRDSFACKPAVIAETPDYVAMASEYHALAGLPGITGARVFEPMPEEIHVWSR